MATVEIIPIPLGSIFVQSIRNSDPDSLNDFPVRIIADENVVLEQSDVSVTSGSSIVSFRGENSVYEAMIRPPTSAGMVTITVASNAVSQGNPQTSKSIRVSTSFPDADAETPTELFNAADGFRNVGIAVTPNRILVTRESGSNQILRSFSHDGTEQVSEQQTISQFGFARAHAIDFFNGVVIYEAGYRAVASNGTELTRYPLLAASPCIHTRLGILQPFNRNVYILPYGTFDANDRYEIGTSLSWLDTGSAIIAHQNDLLYMDDPIRLARITDENEIEFIRRLNIDDIGSDIAIYGDKLYTLNYSLVGGAGWTVFVYTLDIKKYRPLRKNTKTTIPVQFATAGDRLDLTKFSPDAEKFTFAVGFDKPPYLSINASNELVVGAGGTVLVKLTAINQINSVDLEFYLIIQRATNPVWRSLSTLSMRAGSSINLFEYVDADTINFRSGRMQPLESSLSNGIFTIGKTGGRVSFTARKDSRSTHTEFNVHVIQQSDTANFSDIFRHRVEIAGIDVTPDVSEFPTVSKSLDILSLNEYRANDVSLSLKSGRSNNYKYNDEIAGNFWQTHGLNAGGFQVPIHIFIESFVDDEYISHLLFVGVITKATANLENTRVDLKCVDITTELQNTLVQDFGTLEKWDSLRQKSDEASFQGVYTPESSLLPMQTTNAQAWSHLTPLTMRQLALPSEGRPIENSAYLTPQELFTSGGRLEHKPVLKFKTQHRAEDIRFLVKQIALNKKIYNVEIDLPAVSVAQPFILNRGSVPFSVEDTRITRLLTDWAYDSSNTRILMLLSNPESQINDLLIQYDINIDTYRVLFRFDKDVVVHRIERRNATNYYLLTSKPIPQDRSASSLPRPNDSIGYASDSVSEGSEIKIYHYNSGLQTPPTVFVDSDDDYPPQLGIHYHVGFENGLNIDEFEGIRPDYRGAFKWNGSYLYYRYAKDGEFGVARVNTGGTTTKIMGQAVGKYQNHLNFAFDITSTGTIYFVYAIDDANSSTLTIKRRTSGGTESTILTDIRGLAAFSDIHSEFGAYLGAHEVLFHNNQLYILAPMQMADFGDDATNTQADPDFIIEIADTGMTGERNVTTSTNLNPTSRRLAPGDDIPIRIDFNGSISGATQNDLTVSGGTIQSFSISSDMIDVTIHPDDPTRHRNIVIDLAENAVDQNNEATRIIVNFGTRRSREKSAGCVLYRVNLNAGSPSLTVIDTWDFVQLAGCNLTAHSGAVHYVEHPPAGKQFKPYNPDLDGYWTDEKKTQTMRYNVLPDALGALKKVNSHGEVEQLGNLWYNEERPYNVAATRCLSLDDELHLVMGYGDPHQLLRLNSLASKANNYQHLVFGNKLQYVIPEFDSNGSRYELLADIAKKTNSTLSFREGLIRISDRDPFRAETDGQTGTGAGNLDFKNANKLFPDAGYLFIGTEILKYTGITAGAFTGIQRGVLGTETLNHANNSTIYYIDTVIDAKRIKGSPSISTDTSRIHNVIRNSDNTTEETDTDSITAFGELPYTLDLGLTPHELTWEEHISKGYAINLKDPHPLINLTVMPSFYLELEQFVAFRNAGLVYAVQIVSITYSKNETTIRGRRL